MKLARSTRATSHDLVDVKYRPKELYNKPGAIRRQRMEARKIRLFPSKKFNLKGLNNPIVTIQGFGDDLVR